MSSLELWTPEMAYAKSRVSVLRHVSAVTILVNDLLIFEV